MFSLIETNFVSDSIAFICKFVVAKKKGNFVSDFFCIEKEGEKKSDGWVEE